jgi:hypothetical protein
MMRVTPADQETHMSASDHLNEGQFGRPAGPDEQQFKHVWKPSKNEYGRRVEVSETEHGRYTIDGNGAGRKRWSVEYPPEYEGARPDYGVTDTKGEARAWADQDLQERARRA